jgi:DNA-binding beta-propeller fold protein YncE
MGSESMSSEYGGRASRRPWRGLLLGALTAGSLGLACSSGQSKPEGGSGTLGHRALSSAFTPQVLTPPGEAPLALRFFVTPVKTDSQGKIRTGGSTDPVIQLVGAEPAGERGGLQRFTRITFGNDYMTGKPDPGSRVDPNNPILTKGNQFWPFRPQPFRSWPTSLAITPGGDKVYVALPGREGYPDWRVAVVDAASKTVRKWVDLRPAGQGSGTRPTGVEVSPVNAAISPHAYAVVLNQYANYASVIDTVTDSVIGIFQTGFYGEDLVFNASGTRLYVTDRFKDEIRAFRIDPGPTFTQLAEIPTGANELDRANPRDLALSADGRTLYVANTLGHTLAVINVENDANTRAQNMVVGGLATDVKIAGRWGFVSGQATNTALNGPEGAHGVAARDTSGTFRRNNGTPLGYTPVMADATKATTFDDLGSELNVFDTTTQRFVYRYVDAGRDQSMMAVPGQLVDLGDFAAGQKIIQGSGPEQLFVKGDLLFAAMMHSDKVEVFRINQNPADPSGILTELGIQFTGGITPQGLAVSPDGHTLYVANMNTEDLSFLTVNADGTLTRGGYVAVGVTEKTPDPTTGGNGSHLFATEEEIGLRWMFSAAYSDDGQKSCGFCHWQSRSDGSQWNVGANAIGGVKNCPQNKDVSDNWPEWYEGLNNDMTAYASSCSGELTIAERKTVLFPQEGELDRYQARDQYVLRKTAENSAAIGRPELNGKAYQANYNDLSYMEILWTQNETRRMPNPLTQFPASDEAAKVARGRWLFTTKVAEGGSGCADCHHNGNKMTNGVLDDTFQDFNIHEPGVISETTVDGNGPFLRLKNDYVFTPNGAPQDEGSRQNISARNTKHLRSFWDSTPRWLHHGDAHSVREILLAPDSPLLRPGERGFNFRTVRTDHQRAVDEDFLGASPVVLPTEVPITFADSSGELAGDGKGPLYVSLDSPFVTLPEGIPQVDRLGTSNLAPLIVTVNGQRQLNPELAANHIQVIKDTHGKTSHLSESDLDALTLYLLSLE